jgi:hypothetical protein
MKPENIELALNQILEAISKSKNGNDYVFKSFDAINDRLYELVNMLKTMEIANDKARAQAQTQTIDTRHIEAILNSKLSEIYGALNSQIKEYHFSKSYQLYPEGDGKKSLIYSCFKVMSYALAALFLFLSVRYISLKIEDNSNNAKYRIALQYIYIKSDSENKEYMDNLLSNLDNDTLKNEYLNSINKSYIKLK